MPPNAKNPLSELPVVEPKQTELKPNKAFDINKTIEPKANKRRGLAKWLHGRRKNLKYDTRTTNYKARIKHSY